MSFLYFEALLSADEKDVKKLESFILTNQSAGLESNLELHNFLHVIKDNFELHEEITKTLSLYTATFLRPSSDENRTYIELVKIVNKFFPYSDGPTTISALMSAWFIHALSSNSHEALVFAEENLMWRPRYDIIFQVKFLLWRFILQLELTTGIRIAMDENVKTLIWVLLQTLINHGTLKTKTRFVAKNKSEVFVGGVSVSKFLKNQLNLKLLSAPSQLIYIHKSFYFRTKHYSNLQAVFRANTAARKAPHFASMVFLEQLIGMKLYINERLLAKILKAVEQYYKLDLNQPEALAKKLQTLKREMVWNVQSQKQYQKYYRLQYLESLKKVCAYYTDGVYFKYYFDFRGRVYADSPISYTFNKTTRCLYYYGFYTEAEISIISQTLPDVSELITNVILPKTRLNLNYPTIDFRHKVVQYYIYIIFFELGKLRKSALSATHRGRVTLLEFIEAGIECYNSSSHHMLDFDDYVEYLALLDILDALAEQKFIKAPIYKDATASALQLLILLLGPADDKVWDEANFGEAGFWYDTYYGIIARFWEQNPMPDDLKTQYFTRNALKKTIMTHNYQATYLTCLNEFKAHHNLPWDNNDERNRQILPIFKAFYDYLNFLFNSNTYFAVSANTLVQWFKNQWEFERQVHYTTQDNLWIPLEYVKLTKQRVERLILTKRETITWLSKSQEIDEIKMFRAVQANIIHSFDGYLVRSVTTRLGDPIITIHDSFGVDILRIPRIIKITQEELALLNQLNVFGSPTGVKENLNIVSPFVLL